jgi:cytochrome c553
MKTWLKRLGILLAAVVLLLVGVAAYFYMKSGARINREYDVAVAPLLVSDDSSTVARGRHLAGAIALCEGCHGEGLKGKVLFDEPPVATVYAPNLTAGLGGVGSAYSDSDYIRAIRHGVNREARAIMVMHSDAYNYMSPSDLTALVSYIRSLPAADNEVPARTVRPFGRVLMGMGAFDSETMPLFPAEVIDHTLPAVDAPPAGATVEYGRYLATIALCGLCHGRDYTGGPPVEEGAPPAPNIAVYATSGAWTGDQFIGTMRTGVTPYGRSLNAEAMPWEVYRNMTDEELRAIWAFLESLGGE